MTDVAETETVRYRRSAAWAGYLATIAAVAVAAMAAVLAQGLLYVPNASLVFVLPVVFAAATFGWGPALAAAVAGVLAYNFFLIAPRYTFEVAQAADVWALVLLLITAAVVSVIADQARRRAVVAHEAGERAITLQSLARGLVGAASPQEIAAHCAEAVSHLFRAPAVVILEEEEELGPAAAAGGARLDAADREAARWALGARQRTRAGAYPAEEASYDFWPVVTRAHQRALIGVRLSDPDLGRPEATEPLVEIVEGYLAVALDREAYERRALDRRVRAESERLKGDLLAAVSHDLKTPLSTILVSLQSLRRFDLEHDAATRSELLRNAEAETGRLSRMVENLLDMSRIEEGAVTARATQVVRAEVIAAAVQRAGHALADRQVQEVAASEAPLILADAGLLEAALANVLENAGKYSPPGSWVEVRMGEDEGMGWIEVLDEGEGFVGAPERLFDRFVRGRAADGRPPGTGLGLSIARSFLEAQSGRLEAANREDGPGARVRLSAPLAIR